MSGQLTSVSYQRVAQRTCADAMAELANAAPPYGFQFTVDLVDNGGLPGGAVVNLWYPSRDPNG